MKGMTKRGQACEADCYDSDWRTDFRERSHANKLGWERRSELARMASKHIVGSVLDIGCGFGILSRFVKGSYLGVDFSAGAIEKAKWLSSHRDDEWHTNPKARFLVGDIRDLPGLGQFDTVTMLEVLEHLDDPAQAIETAHRLATQRIVVSVPRHGVKAQSHVWPIWEPDNVTSLLGEGSTCRRYRRWLIGVKILQEVK
jgi:2-polyprenyl-3-methyl-5-hydroxy-6-metoxy-1,4-benzoquinol methylase